MGGKVGVAGGRGFPQHDPDEGRFDLGITLILITLLPFQTTQKVMLQPL